MIRLMNLTKTYPGSGTAIHAVRNVNLAIRPGEIFGIIGKSGAGKSTLIRCINMLERPSGGQVLVNGQDLTAMAERDLRAARQKIGMIFQHFNLLSSRTVYDNVAFPLELARDQSSAEAVPHLLELVGLSDKSDQYPAQLSGGQKQRVGIARALASQPKVLLCDEATSALDPQTTKSILRLLQDINRRLNLTIVLITHEMQVIKEICHRVAVIEDGRIIEQGPVIDLFTRPQTPTTREFISSVINPELPEVFAETQLSPTPLADGNLLLRLSFVGQTAGEPIIARMIRQFDVNANILYGNIDTIQNMPFGTLTIELSGEPGALQNAINYLGAHNLSMEVLGYVQRNARAAG